MKFRMFLAMVEKLSMITKFGSLFSVLNEDNLKKMEQYWRPRLEEQVKDAQSRYKKTPFNISCLKLLFIFNQNICSNQQ